MGDSKASSSTGIPQPDRRPGSKTWHVVGYAHATSSGFKPYAFSEAFGVSPAHVTNVRCVASEAIGQSEVDGFWSRVREAKGI